MSNFASRSRCPRSRHLSVSLLVCALAVSAGCATKPKTVSSVASAPTSTTSEAAATTLPAPQPPARIAQALPPIARAEAFSDGEQRGLAPQARAAETGQALSRAAATLSEAGDRIYFLTDRYDLTDEARAILARQAAWISANPSKRVIIAGSADERGTREYNLALGSRRAATTRDYLVSLGVNSASIETISYGKERPIDARSNPDGWAVNRNSLTQLLD
jgi:peptidoglycan-associated lipoprotein